MRGHESRNYMKRCFQLHLTALRRIQSMMLNMLVIWYTKTNFLMWGNAGHTAPQRVQNTSPGMILTKTMDHSTQKIATARMLTQSEGRRTLLFQETQIYQHAMVSEKFIYI